MENEIPFNIHSMEKFPSYFHSMEFEKNFQCLVRIVLAKIGLKKPKSIFTTKNIKSITMYYYNFRGR